MKTELEKKGEEFDNNKISIVVDSSLNKYQGKILFPKKLSLAEEQLRGVTLPETKKYRS